LSTLSQNGKFLEALARSWFGLTRDEQKAVLVLLGLFLLGVSIRCWHVWRTAGAGAAPAPRAAVSSAAQSDTASTNMTLRYHSRR
jgi:hypothetical protein